jgi:threonine aldolase
MIDLRSDTVTKPCAEMRRAMAEAEVGDDVYGEDPTVQRLEEEGAAALGKEAALFVPSGTMGNQIALHLWGERGSEVVCDARCHVVDYEMAAMAALSGLLPRIVASADGLPAPAEFAAAIVPTLPYRARTTVLVVENTHNMAGGTAFGRDRIDPVLEVARGAGLRTHLDGARIFNAALALGCTAAGLARGFDSVMFCLSKGLGAPVGSLLCGETAFIAEARRARKRFGGGMRQVGVLAAAGRIALSKGPGWLLRDHENARFLAERLAAIEGVEIDPQQVRTNIVIAETAPAAAALVGALRVQGVLAVPVGAHRVRFVTHRDVARDAIETALDLIRRAMAASG